MLYLLFFRSGKKFMKDQEWQSKQLFGLKRIFTNVYMISEIYYIITMSEDHVAGSKIFYANKREAIILQQTSQ